MPQSPTRRELNKSLKSGDGGGTFEDMETRVRALEDKFARIEVKLDRLAEDVSKINEDVKEIKGKISNMPSTWQMMGICAALLGFVISGGGIGLTLAKFLQS